MNRLRTTLAWAFFVFCVWAFVGDLVFAFRHPWMTDTQRAFHLWDVLTFQQVPRDVVPTGGNDNAA